MNNYKALKVYLGDKKVGTLALTNNHLVAFEYDDGWISGGFSLNPIDRKSVV